MKTLHNIVRRPAGRRAVARVAVRGVRAALLLTAGSAFAGEYAVLTNGFRLHADRHEISGGTVRLYANGGSSELALAAIATWENEEAQALPQPKPTEAVAPPAAPQQSKTTGDLYAETAKRHGIPEALVRSIVRAESNGNPRALSPKGAIGLMQLMPGTARELGVDPTIPEQNVEGGTRYLRSLLARYEDKEDQVARAVAAYNAGPGAVEKYHGVPPYRETQLYVRRVLTQYLKSQ